MANPADNVEWQERGCDDIERGEFFHKTGEHVLRHEAALLTAGTVRVSVATDAFLQQKNIYK